MLNQCIANNWVYGIHPVYAIPPATTATGSSNLETLRLDTPLRPLSRAAQSYAHRADTAGHPSSHPGSYIMVSMRWARPTCRHDVHAM
jgi:hypothetical protein